MLHVKNVQLNYYNKFKIIVVFQIHI